MSETSSPMPGHRHGNRIPEDLTDAEQLRAAALAETLYPNTLLSHSGDPEDERNIRRAIVEAELLDNPSLRPDTSADGADGSAEAEAVLDEAEARGEPVEAGPGIVRVPDDPLVLSLAELVNTQRRRLGLSQRQLAERAGMRQPHISRLEAGVHAPDIETLVRVARALGMSLDIIIDPDGARLKSVDAASRGVLFAAERARGGTVIDVVAHIPPERPGWIPYRALFSFSIEAIVGRGKNMMPPPIEVITLNNREYRVPPHTFSPEGGSFPIPFVFRFSSAPSSQPPPEIPISIVLPGGPGDLYRGVRLTVGIGSIPGARR